MLLCLSYTVIVLCTVGNAYVHNMSQLAKFWPIIHSGILPNLLYVVMLYNNIVVTVMNLFAEIVP